jgi:hypothetical protein
MNLGQTCVSFALLVIKLIENFLHLCPLQDLSLFFLVMVFLKESFAPTTIQQELLVNCDVYFTYGLTNDIKQLELRMCESVYLYVCVYISTYVYSMHTRKSTDISIFSLLHRIVRGEWSS